MKTLFLFSMFALPMCLLAQERQTMVVQMPSQSCTFDLQKELLSFDGSSVVMTRSAMQLNSKPEGYRWIDRMTNMPDYLMDFYKDYGTQVDQVFDGSTSSWLSDPTKAIEVHNGQYGVKVKSFTGIKTFKVPEKASSETVKKLAADAINDQLAANWDEAQCFFPYLAMSLTYDYAEAFWVSSRFTWSNNSQSSISWKGTDGSVEYTQDIYYILKDDNYIVDNEPFDVRRAMFHSPSSILSGVLQYYLSVQQICELIPGGADRYDIVKFFNDWLTKNNYYNPYLRQKTNTDMAWSPLSALAGMGEKDAPVCEGYARAFKVLCDRQNIPCILIVGNAKDSRAANGESHMWNEVQMNDGKWYAVDVTWNDPVVNNQYGVKVSGHETDKWLLLGRNSIVADNFTFAESHPNSLGWDVDDAFLQRWSYDISSLIADEKYENSSSIEIVPAAQEKAYYTIDGKPASGIEKGMYIMRNNQKTSKVILK